MTLAHDELSDREFLNSLGWRRGVPTELRQAARNGDGPAFVRVWLDHLATRQLRRKVVVPETQAAGLWSLEAFHDRSDRCVQWLTMLEACTRSARRRVKPRRTVHAPGRTTKAQRAAGPGFQTTDQRIGRLLAPADHDQPATAASLLASVEILSQYGSRLSTRTAWQLWRLIVTEASRCDMGLHATNDDTLSAGQRLLGHGELPWQLGLVFRELPGAAEWRRQGQTLLRSQLLEQTDGDGTPDAELMECLGVWLASLSRSSSLAARFDVPLWNEQARNRLESLLRVVASMCLPDGQIALSNGKSQTALTALQTAMPLVGLSQLDASHRYVLGVAPHRRSSSKDGSTSSTLRTNAGERPVIQSDWAQLACLRSDWSSGADTVVVAHDRTQPRIHLAAQGQTVLSGVWAVAVTVDDVPIEPGADWDCVCWHSDEDGDFLEIQLKLDQVRIERQVLLSRTDRFLLLADAVTTTGPSRIEVKTGLPLMAGFDAVPGGCECEWALKRGRTTVARCFPLALPPHSTLRPSGHIGTSQGRLILQQTAEGGAVYAPLIIDWHPQRRHRPAEWRTLTVSERGKAVPAHVASGHRLRVGDHQILVYRSLKNTGVFRAVLGYHTRYETAIGRFDGSGDVTPILLVE